MHVQNQYSVSTENNRTLKLFVVQLHGNLVLGAGLHCQFKKNVEAQSWTKQHAQ